MSAPGGFPSSDPNQAGRNPHLPKKRPPFTKEELQVLKECNSESFWYRCLPFGLAMMGGSQYLVNSGVLKPHPKYGAIFKNLAALFVGYLAGKFSYQGQCRQKIMQKIPNSNLAQAIRRKGPFDLPPEITTLPDMTSPGSSDPSMSHPRDEMRSSDFDTDKTPTQIPTGLDDSKRPTMDKEGFPASGQESEQIFAPNYKSYDEMRQQNRMEYDRKMLSKDSPLNQRPWPPPAAPSSQAPPGDELGFNQGRAPWRRQRQERDTSSKQKNKYGDEWEE